MYQVISDPDPTLQVVLDPDRCPRNFHEISYWSRNVNKKNSSVLQSNDVEYLSRGLILTDILDPDPTIFNPNQKKMGYS